MRGGGPSAATVTPKYLSRWRSFRLRRLLPARSSVRLPGEPGCRGPSHERREDDVQLRPLLQECVVAKWRVDLGVGHLLPEVRDGSCQSADILGREEPIRADADAEQRR